MRCINHCRSKRPHRASRVQRGTGFTLIELLVVVAIIALLISILLPSLGRAREMAKITKCAPNMRTSGMAVLYYTEDKKGQMPPPWLWAESVRPFVRRQTTTEKFTGANKMDKNRIQQVVRFYMCPSDYQGASTVIKEFMDVGGGGGGRGGGGGGR